MDDDTGIPHVIFAPPKQPRSDTMVIANEQQIGDSDVMYIRADVVKEMVADECLTYEAWSHLNSFS